MFAAVYCGISLLIFRRKPDGRMALFVSLALLTFGTASFPDTMKALSVEHPLWQCASSSLTTTRSSAGGCAPY